MTLLPDEFTRAGRDWLRRLPADVQRDNAGRFIAIDVESGKHYIADTIPEALEHARAKSPDANFYVGRIGAPAASKLHSP